jgi:4-carboxymuconolactone decarboxylase
MNLRRVLTTAWGALVVMMMSQAGFAQDRMPRIPPEKRTAAQQQAVADFLQLRGPNSLTSSFETLLRSPELMVRTSAIGEYVRRSVLPPRLYEFIVVVTARHLDSQYEWDAHYKPALDAGLSQALLQDLVEGRAPSMLTNDERILWDLLDELHRTNRVSDATYGRALARFGEQGIIDAVATSGYYMMLGAVLNTAQTQGVGGAPTLKPRRQ